MVLWALQGITVMTVMQSISRSAALCGAPRALIRACTLEPDLGSTLQSTFERALAHQRASDLDGALARYELFVQAAEQVDIPPLTYAEVLVNMGAIYAKRQDSARARDFFERALRLRDLSSAHVNLALLELAAGSESRKGQMPVEALVNAERHCRRAIALGDDPSSFATAQRVLQDIERSKAGGRG
mmetsp:Transcript_33619/g.108631  ORF Transcript_33619/g.108631 Transcript_33619/m.108631 type:complete len:186 (+) Transcript_33619:15-572(+)